MMKDSTHIGPERTKSAVGKDKVARTNTGWEPPPGWLVFVIFILIALMLLGYDVAGS